MVEIRYAREDDILNAFVATNVRFKDNITFNRYDRQGKKWFVTLKVRDSHKEGARRGFDGHRMAFACWHVYGVFFDELIAQNDKIVIVAMGKKISRGCGNWEDKNVGSMTNPRLYSEMCDCIEMELF